MNVTTSSKRFSLNGNDFIKGLIVAALSPIVPIIMDSLNSGSLTFDWKHIATAALGGLVAYITKNFFDKPKIVVTDVKDSTIDAVKDGTAQVEVQHQ